MVDKRKESTNHKLLRFTRYTEALERISAAKAKNTGGYLWRTVGDDRVRPGHEILEGHYFDWDNPPVIDEYGNRGHPGMTYNCRCHAEPFERGEQATEELPHMPAGCKGRNK